MLDPNYSDLLSAFHAHEVRFLVVGAYALGVHGRPRATMDFDVWVDASGENAPRVLAALRDFGAPLHGISEQDLASPGIGLQIGVAPVRVDILTQISGITFAEAWDRRVPVRLGPVDCFVISAADMITNKRAAGRPKDLADAEALQQILKGTQR
jgi:uncharacterized nucleotidyltransferase DUF6036